MLINARSAGSPMINYLPLRYWTDGKVASKQDDENRAAYLIRFDTTASLIPLDTLPLDFNNLEKQ
jgi:hypothetical protein